jgi:hypothetical protein
MADDALADLERVTNALLSAVGADVLT